MLFGHRPHILRPSRNVLVWGAAGGFSRWQLRLIATAGANAIGVISRRFKTGFVMSLGAKGVVNRSKFDCWGQLPPVSMRLRRLHEEVREFGRAVWESDRQGGDVDFAW